MKSAGLPSDLASTPGNLSIGAGWTLYPAPATPGGYPDGQSSVRNRGRRWRDARGTDHCGAVCVWSDSGAPRVDPPRRWETVMRPFRTTALVRLLAATVTGLAIIVCVDVHPSSAAIRPVANCGNSSERACPIIAGSPKVSKAYLGPARKIVSHQNAARQPGATTFSATSQNWDGYAVTGTTFTSIQATWIQPTVTCQTNNAYALFWVGLDGWESSTVEQVGTEAQCGSAGSSPAYNLWWEMYPTNFVQTVTPVKPGDKIQASVVRSNTTYTLTLDDVTASKHFSTVQSCATCAATSAEVISEAPGMGLHGNLFPLADYGTMSYSNANVKDSSRRSGPLDASQWTTWSISENDPVTPNFATVSPLNSTGTGFTATWLKDTQAIVFTSTPPSKAVIGGPTYTVTASGGSSGNSVAFSSYTPHVCTVAGSTVSFVGIGTCTIDGNQAGNAFYSAAPQVQQSFPVVAGSCIDNGTLCITSSPSDVVTSGSFFSFPVTASGMPTPRIKEKGKLPKGAKFHKGTGSATLSGTPTSTKHKSAVGTYHLTFTATYGKGKTKKVVTQAFTLTVSA